MKIINSLKWNKNNYIIKVKWKLLIHQSDLKIINTLKWNKNYCNETSKIWILMITIKHLQMNLILVLNNP